MWPLKFYVQTLTESKNTMRSFLICPNFGGQRNMIPVLVRSNRVSRKINQDTYKLVQTSRLLRKMISNLNKQLCKESVSRN